MITLINVYIVKTGNCSVIVIITANIIENIGFLILLLFVLYRWLLHNIITAHNRTETKKQRLKKKTKK